MFVTDAWLDEQGEDAPLLRSIAQGFPDEGPVAVAVSGGGDSLAALHLAKRIGHVANRLVFAVTVDHGLRAASRQEAEGVAAFCRRIEVAHETLTWREPAHDKNLQDQARRARYGLMAEWAQVQGIRHLILGHTSDDQAETFLMQVARGAGVDGLSSMGIATDRCGVTLLRPLLEHSRDDLRRYLLRHDIDWVDDPTNDDETYQRIRVRKAQPSLSALGLTSGAIGQTVSALQSAKSALDYYTDVEIEKWVKQDVGDVLIPRDLSQLVPFEIERRIWLRTLKWVGNAGYGPRQSAFEGMLRTVAFGQKATLHGCLMTPEAGQVRVSREPSAVFAHERPAGQVWDGRWIVEGPFAATHHIAALGESGLLSCPNWRETGRKRTSLLASPAVWEGNNLVAAPLAGVESGWTVRFATNL
jgi:tRNA(Ile)-lysidine synthase